MSAALSKNSQWEPPHRTGLKYMPLIFIYIATAATFVVIDLMWLGFIAKGFYSSQMGDLLASDTKVGVAVAFYAAYIVGIMYFAIMPTAGSDSPISGALLKGFLFGLFCYGTYDFTNWATTANWPWKLAIVDTIWGSILTATAATAGAYALVMMKA